MEAALQFDPSGDHEAIEIEMALAGDYQLSNCFREHGRLWSKSEFQTYIKKLQKQKRIDDTKLYQLPHSRALVRYDILQFAHAQRIRKKIGEAK